jgi:hypothetical protein
MLRASLAILALAAVTTSPANPAPPTALILTCDMGPPPGQTAGPSQTRVFRLAPKSFQEWRPTEHKFGNNLCLSFPCARENGKLRGVIRSATLEVTIEADPAAGAGSWKALGASGHSRSEGPCQVQPEAAWRAQHP